jgi:1-phosphatidylinositol phosphodiesterase
LAVVLGPAETAQASGLDPTDAYRSLKENAHPDWMADTPDATSLASSSVPGTHDTFAVRGGIMVTTQENHEGDPMRGRN